MNRIEALDYALRYLEPTAEHLGSRSGPTRECVEALRLLRQELVEHERILDAEEASS